MTANEFQKESVRIERGMKRIIVIREEDGMVASLYPDGHSSYCAMIGRLLNGLMGLNGEAGECIDIVKKHLFHAHPLGAEEREHLAKELGDVAFYLAVIADALEFSLEEIFEMNVEKLKNRYPNGFEPERSINRVKGDI